MVEKRSRRPVPPMERKREVMELISQGTRHQILQAILGHPKHLPTLAELDHMIPSKSTSTIEEAAENLVEGGVVATYEVSNAEIKESGLSARDNPNKFYGLSEEGVRTLDEFEFLRSVPILRAVYDNTNQTEKTQRHQDAIRPDLPESVVSALSLTSVVSRQFQANQERIGACLPPKPARRTKLYSMSYSKKRVDSPQLTAEKPF